MTQEEAGATEPAKPAMSDQERAALVAKMDRELEEHFAELEARAAGREGQVGKSRVEGFNEDNWEEEMAKHPFFNEEWKEGKELSPLMQGMQDLKYSPDENTPEELARSYKEDGNFNFKCKKYRFAVASYTEGLRAKSSEVEINTQLVTNRAAAQFHLGNFRSCLLDCKLAVRLNSGHMKAIVRGAQCCLQLKQYADCVAWCVRGLNVEPGQAELARLQGEATRLGKLQQRDERKRQAEERRKGKEEAELLETIRQRGIKLADQGGLSLSALEPRHPAALQRRVRLEAGQLIWPVLLLYPEHGETDLIEEFRETETFKDHLAVVFSEAAPWDPSARYRPETVELYFENGDADLVAVGGDWSLAAALSHHTFHLQAGTPGFIVLVRGSKAHKDFISKYRIVK